MNVLEQEKVETTLLDNKILKEKKLEDGLTFKMMKNHSSERILVEFSCPNGKLRLVLQKSYQDTFAGRLQAEAFENSIKSLADLKAYFRIK